MKPRKRRPRLSDEHKAKLAASNAEFRFQPASRDAPEAQECEVRGRVGCDWDVLGIPFDIGTG